MMAASPYVPDHDTLYGAMVRELDRRIPRALQHSGTTHEVIEAAVAVIGMLGLMPAAPAEPLEEELPVSVDVPYRQVPHRYCGSSSERQSVGDPGHCEACCSVGHIVAHPDFGYSDVGCDREHADGPDAERYGSPRARGQVAPTLLDWTVPDHIMTFDVAPGEHTLWCFKHQPRIDSGRILTEWAVGGFLRTHAHGHVVERRKEFVSQIPPHLAAMANENGDVRFNCPRCDWFAQVPVDAKGVFLHAVSDARMGHAAIAHPETWGMWRVNDPDSDLIRRLNAEIENLKGMLGDEIEGR